MPLSDLCCGSAGIYNVLHTGMAMALLRKKMDAVKSTGAQVIVTANPGCMLQLAAGARRFSHGEKVVHVVEILDQAYRAAKESKSAS
jgi:glycolate oxidase iron-sulfur subunit